MKKVIVLLGILVLSSCETGEIRKNDPNDRKEAEIIAKKFYDKVSNNDTLSIYSELDPSMADIEGFKALIRDNLKKSGPFNKFDINKIYTEKTIIEDKEEVNYNIELTVYYDNHKNVESIAFNKNDSNAPVMIAYYYKTFIEH